MTGERETTTPVHRLRVFHRDSLRAHFLALEPADVRLRFGSVVNSGSIEQYVNDIDFERDAVFGVLDAEFTILGAAHLAIGADLAELGVSVASGHRGRGIGSALFARAEEYARNRYLGRVFMHCLAENAPMMHIARRAGMQIIVDTGEADAFLALAQPTPASMTGEFLQQRLALFDYALKSQLATLRRLTGVTLGTESGK